MTLGEYQAEAIAFARFRPIGHDGLRPLFAAFAHMGRVSERVKKAFRDAGGEFNPDTLKSIETSVAELVKNITTALQTFQDGSKDTISHNFFYPLIGLLGEAGETAEKLLPSLDRDLTRDEVVEIGREMGDVLWYLAALSATLGLDLGEVARWNLEKLHSRLERGKIHGEGDNR